MGVDLTLLPYDCDQEDFCFSHTVLTTPRDYALYESINKLDKHEVCKDFTSYYSRDDAYEEPHYGVTTEDCYGAAVFYVIAEDLKQLEMPGPTGAYITALPDETKIALFWH